MNALILVGGLGSRLQPITSQIPKPLIPVAGTPNLERLIQQLKKINIKRVILALGFSKEKFSDFILYLQKEYDIEIICSEEQEPLGTAGPLKLAEKYLKSNSKKETKDFIVMNSDIVADFPLEQIIQHHQERKSFATIVLKEVLCDFSRYGIILTQQENGKVLKFVEKPQEYIGNQINAGFYVLNEKILERIPLRNCSIEREIFPQLADQENVQSFSYKDYWIDIGTPLDYFKSNQILLSNKERLSFPQDFHLIKNSQDELYSLIHKTSQISPDSILQGNCIIYPLVQIKGKCIINSSYIFQGSTIEESTLLENSIVLNNQTVNSQSKFLQNKDIRIYYTPNQEQFNFKYISFQLVLNQKN